MLEQDLVTGLKRGDKKVFSLVFRQFYKTVLAYAYSFTQNRHLAQDFVQESFMDLWNCRHKLRADTVIKSYLYRLVYNKFIDYYRKQQVQTRVLDQLKYQRLAEISFVEKEGGLERIEKLKQGIALLPPKCKEVLLLSKMERLTYKEIAEHLGITVKTVESQMRIAFIRLKAFMD
jgi:RNA polymerase sigma-70 factor (ECF subfamily)